MFCSIDVNFPDIGYIRLFSDLQYPVLWFGETNSDSSSRDVCVLCKSSDRAAGVLRVFKPDLRDHVSFVKLHKF